MKRKYSSIEDMEGELQTLKKLRMKEEKISIDANRFDVPTGKEFERAQAIRKELLEESIKLGKAQKLNEDVTTVMNKIIKSVMKPSVDSAIGSIVHQFTPESDVIKVCKRVSVFMYLKKYFSYPIFCSRRLVKFTFRPMTKLEERVLNHLSVDLTEIEEDAYMDILSIAYRAGNTDFIEIFFGRIPEEPEPIIRLFLKDKRFFFFREPPHEKGIYTPKNLINFVKTDDWDCFLKS
jgi:hypothetical protein